jgi:hypothetical protein
MPGRHLGLKYPQNKKGICNDAFLYNINRTDLFGIFIEKDFTVYSVFATADFIS